MDVDEEFSAFQEVTEDMIRAKEEAKAEKERMKKLEKSQKVMRVYGIDFQGAQLYFKQLKDTLNKTNLNEYNECINSLIEVINHENSQNMNN